MCIDPVFIHEMTEKYRRFRRGIICLAGRKSAADDFHQRRLLTVPQRDPEYIEKVMPDHHNFANMEANR